MTDLLVDRQSGVTRLTLNRPNQYNALSSDLLLGLSSALDEISEDDATRAVVLAASGKAFCAGHDLKQMRALETRDNQHELFTLCSSVMQKINDLPQPVVASVQGMATAAGCQLVATCDLAVAANTAQFAVSGVRVGLFCSTPAVALSRNISRKRAMEMLLTGDFIDAPTALEYGLVNRICEPSELDSCVDQLVQRIIDKPKRVIMLGKNLFYRQLNQPLDSAYRAATDVISDNMMMPETLEGIDAFLQKRKPDWEKF
ncbi:MAG: enoyl-CoA hydratase [Pseudomonadota bacterium]